jgi:uncharacterized GH25 family protein
MKRLAAISVILLLSLTGLSHEFWLQSKKYWYKVGEVMDVAFMAGENFQGEPWDLSINKVERIEIHQGVAVKRLESQVTTTKGKNLSYKFDREGTYMLAMESNFAFIEQDAENFNKYLEADGLEAIANERKKAGRAGEGAKEFYKRYAKLIVQCGDKQDASFKRSAGFRYEIFPMANPASLKPGDYLDCQVTWEKRPAPHAMVKVWSFVGNRIFLQNIYTEKDGTIRFPISSAGPWMVSSVKMIPSEQAGADYQSQWASLVFEIPPASK